MAERIKLTKAEVAQEILDRLEVIETKLDLLLEQAQVAPEKLRESGLEPEEYGGGS